MQARRSMASGLLLGLMATGAVAAGVWTVEPLATNLALRSVLRVDAAGETHALYQEAGAQPAPQQPVYYALRSAAGWSSATQVLAQAGSVDLAVNASNRPSVLAAVSNQLLHAYPVGAAWATETITSGALDYQALSAAAHPGGEPAVAYFVPLVGIRYAERAAGSWQTALVKATEPQALLGLRVNGEGTPVIVYRDDQDALVVAFRSGGVWTTQVAAAASGAWVEWGFDSSQRCHLVYEEKAVPPAYCRQILHTRQAGDAWVTETVVSNSFGVYHPSLAAGPDGAVAVAYKTGLGGFPGTIQYTVNRTGAWVEETATANAEFSVDPRLGVDAIGEPHIAYRAFGETGVRCTHHAGLGWTDELVETNPCLPVAMLAGGAAEPAIHLDTGGVSFAQRQPQWWDDAVAVGGNWQWSPWFGFFNVSFAPWIYHLQHDWMYGVGRTAQDVWLWTMDMDWLWTAEGVYPSLYRATDSTWLWYLTDSDNPRWFADLIHGGWEER